MGRPDFSNKRRDARAKWRKHYGPIPPKHHIHHRDGNPCNNALENLACVPASLHLSMHQKDRVYDPEHLARIRPLTVAWHRSTAGRQWHSDHAKTCWRPRAIEKRCDYCGRAFTDRSTVQGGRFCTNACKSAARRADGRDNVRRQCVECFQIFVTNRYSKAIRCSPACVWRLRHRRRGQDAAVSSVQSDG